MPYQAPYAQYTPMAPFTPPPATAAPSSGQLLAEDTAQIQPALDTQRAQYQQAIALQQQILAQQQQAQQQQNSRFYYSSPPWGTRQAMNSRPVAPPQAPAPAPAATPPAASTNRTPQEMAAALTAGSKKFSGRIPNAQELTDLLRETGFVKNDQGRYAMPQTAY